MKSKPILVLDFDGVIHSYTSGWKSATVIPDPPTPDALEILSTYTEHFDVCIYSSRSRQWGGKRAMKKWLIQAYVAAAVPYEGCPEWLRDLVARNAFADPWEEEARWFAKKLIRKLRWPTKKPSAFLTIDDRCVCFDGTWPDVSNLKTFKPWNTQKV